MDVHSTDAARPATRPLADRQGSHRHGGHQDIPVAVPAALILLAVAVLLMVPAAGARGEVHAVITSTLLAEPVPAEDYGATSAIAVSVDGPVDGHLRARILSGGRTVNRMWNGTAWVYPHVYDRALPVQATGNWMGTVLVRLYRPYFPDGGIEDHLTVSLTYRDRNGSEQKTVSFDVNVVRPENASTLRLIVTAGPLDDPVTVTAEGPGRATTMTAGLGVLDRMGDDPNRTPTDAGVRWPGEARLDLPPGNWTVTVGDLNASVGLTVGETREVRLGPPPGRRIRIVEVCVRPHGDDVPWVELASPVPTDLTGWVLHLGPSPVELPKVTIDGVLLVRLDGGPSVDGDVVHLPAWPAPPAGGGEICLLTPEGRVEDWMAYGPDPPDPPTCWTANVTTPGRADYLAQGSDGAWREEWWGNATPGYVRGGGSSVPGDLRLMEVYAPSFATGDADEFVVIGNVRSAPVDLDGWDITDWEEVMPLEGSLPPGGRAIVVRNASALARIAPGLVGNGTPDIPGTMPPAIVMDGLTLRLADDGDEVALRWLGEVVDAVVWGEGGPCPGWTGDPVTAPREGEILVRPVEG
ncbi:MAG TPA: hypothetical protein EYP43_03050, partial [Thermoplasmata archaeon]|nr:hypothetical protein [Thermoplasmata archaeon]